tara:strand:- start:654 stop:1553 length:900 start_codon:yes stop_codon:yes gene_type:complete
MAKTYDSHIRVVVSDEDQLDRSVIADVTRGFSSSDIDVMSKQTILVPSGLNLSTYTINLPEFLNSDVAGEPFFTYAYTAQSGTPDTSLTDVTDALGELAATTAVLNSASDDVLYLGFPDTFDALSLDWSSGSVTTADLWYSTSTASGIANYTELFDVDSPDDYGYDGTSVFGQDGRIVWKAPDDWVKTVYPYFGTDPIDATFALTDAVYWIRIVANTGGASTINGVRVGRVAKFLLITANYPVQIKIGKDEDNEDVNAATVVRANAYMIRDGNAREIQLDTPASIQDVDVEINVMVGLG